MGCGVSKTAADQNDGQGSGNHVVSCVDKAQTLPNKDLLTRSQRTDSQADQIAAGSGTEAALHARGEPDRTPESGGHAPVAGLENAAAGAISLEAGTNRQDLLVRSHEEGRDSSLTRRVSSPVPEAPANPEDAYTGAPLPANEDERLETVCRLGASHSQPEDRFDDITKLLCQTFHVPVAIVSLVEKDRQFFKSVQGLPVNSTERRASFCAWTLLPQHPEVLVVPNALQDIRFADNPLVLAEPHIRFYAGAPLVTSSGLRLGSLCIIDRKPRELEAESCSVLINFAEIVVRELEKELMKAAEDARFKSQASGFLQAFEDVKEGIMVCSSASPELNIIFFNDAWSKLAGLDRSVLGRSVWDVFESTEKKEKMVRLSRDALEHLKPFSVDLIRHTSDGVVRFTASFRPASSDGLRRHAPAVAIPGSMASLKADGVADNLYFCTTKEMHAASDDSSGAFALTEDLKGRSLPFPDVQLGPLLGQGSFGKVYRGIWNGTHIAVKIIQPQQGRSSQTGSLGESLEAPDGSEKAAQEAELTVQLAHPNIVCTYKSARVPYIPESSSAKSSLLETWMLLEYCDQGTLQYAIERGKFDEGFITSGKRSRQPFLPGIRQTALEIAAAMAYLHARDILHGDLCGGNILLTASTSDDRGFLAKVADFGLARSMSAEAIMTQTYGTVTHMPPELLTTGQLGKAADSYAFGTILWELCTGDRPWAGMLPMQVIYHVTILSKSLAFPDTTPEAYSKLGAACMHPDPTKRPTFAEILVILNQL